MHEAQAVIDKFGDGVICSLTYLVVLFFYIQILILLIALLKDEKLTKPSTHTYTYTHTSEK